MSEERLSEGALHDMQMCFALVSMSALALKQVGDNAEEARSAVYQMRQVMDLAKSFAEQVLSEIEASNPEVAES